MNIRPKIVVVDSGINLQHPKIDRDRVSGAGIIGAEAGYAVTDNYEDEIGHGTAITYIIQRLLPDCEIVMLKIFEDDLTVSIYKLRYVLEYISEHIACDIVHLSLGMKMCEDIPALRSVCERLRAKGVILVSSFDNDGSLSYPAILSCVIGVDQSTACRQDEDFIFVSRGEGVNVLAKGIGQKLPWVNPSYVLGSQVIALLAAAIYMIWINQWLAVAILILMPIAMFGSHLMRRRLQMIGEKVAEQHSAVRQSIQDMLQGMETIRAYAAESWFLDRYRQEKERLNRLSLRQMWLNTAMESLSSTMAMLLVWTSVLIIAWLAKKGLRLKINNANLLTVFIINELEVFLHEALD